MNRSNEFQPSAPLWANVARAAETLDIDPAQTEKLTRDILLHVPGQQHSLTLLVSAMRAKGDTEGARATLEGFAAEFPNLAAVHYELGMLLAELGDRPGAVRALSRVVELEPKHPTAWRALADELAETGDTEAAANAYAKQFESSIVDLKTLETMSALGLDQVDIAGNILREFLTIHPTDANALQMLGRIYMRINQFEAAERVFARALDIAPEFTAARHDYLQALRHQMKWDAENAQLDILLEQDPENTSYRYLKALSLARSDKSKEALAYCETLVRDAPGEAMFWRAYAYALRTIGRSEECVAAFRKSVELNPGAGETWWGLANLKTFRFSPADIETMRAQFGREDLPAEDRAHLHFALGKAFEDGEAYETSFEEYRRGNALFRAQNPYDAEEMHKGMLHTKEQFTAEFFRDRKGAGSTAKDPIFILGMPRSGSTLVEQILSSHSSVEGAGELSCLGAVAMRLEVMERARAAGEGPPTDGFARENLKALGEEYLARAKNYRKRGRPFFTDKMPNNFHHLGLIGATLPNAKIIDIRRHPLACCFSNYKQIFPSRSGPSYDLADMGRYYCDYVEVMAHFDRVLPGRVHRVIYEELVANPEKEIRRLLEHCGLPFEESCLRFYETERGIFTASSEQVRRPVYTDSLEVWRHYERWLGPLKSALGPVLDLYPAVPSHL